MQEINKKINSLAEEISKDTILTEVINPRELREFLVTGMSDLLNRAILAERDIYLKDNKQDSANGYSPERAITLATAPVRTTIPRTRSGDFYPSLLTKYERTIPEDYDRILLNLLLNAKNFAAVKRTLQSLNLPYRPDQLDALIEEIYHESKALYSRRLSPDWYFIYIDAKVIDLSNEHNQVDKAVVFTVVGVSDSCKKEVLGIYLFWGNESTDLWKQVLLDLKNRGVTRVLMIITDDFSGLLPIMKSIYPDTDHQLCHVHLLRNALRHLDKNEYAAFKCAINDCCTSPDFKSARSRFIELTTTLKAKYPDYAKHLLKRADQFCHFTQFPRTIRQGHWSLAFDSGLVQEESIQAANFRINCQQFCRQ